MNTVVVKNISFDVFTEEIEFLCEFKNMEYIDAVVHWCETNNVEVEYAANMIKRNQVMKLKIQEEAENLNIIQKTPRLPS